MSLQAKSDESSRPPMTETPRFPGGICAYIDIKNFIDGPIFKRFFFQLVINQTFEANKGWVYALAAWSM
jgi:hypothetical protein